MVEEGKSLAEIQTALQEEKPYYQEQKKEQAKIEEEKQKIML